MWRLLTNRRVLQAAAIMGILLVVALWPEAIDVDVGTVSRGAMVVSLGAKGETRIHHRLTIAAPVAGTIEAIDLESGNGVVVGQTVLARLTPDPVPPLDAWARREAAAVVTAARAEMSRVEAEVQRAASALEVARDELKLAQEQFEAGQIPQQSLEARRNIVSSAEETLNAARYASAEAAAALDRARGRLAPPRRVAGKPLEIVAPVDGVVLRVIHGDAGPVQAGEPLLEIGDPSHVEIVAPMPADDAAKVRPGMRVYVEHWGGDTPLPAWVERVDPDGAGRGPEAAPPHLNVLIDFEDDREAWTAMGEGFHVDVRIAIWEQEDVRRVPTAALFKVGEQWAVYVVDNGRAHRTIVDLGQRTDTEAEVRNGLRSGQQVVLSPPDTLTDNARVAIRGE